MGDEQYPDGLTAEEWATMKDDYLAEWEKLRADCLKKDGTPRKDATSEDLERLALLSVHFGPEPAAEEFTLEVGDKFKGTDDYTVYVVSIRESNVGLVYTRAPWTVEAEPFHKLLEGRKEMDLELLTHNVATGLWKYLGNVSGLWA